MTSQIPSPGTGDSEAEGGKKQSGASAGERFETQGKEHELWSQIPKLDLIPSFTIYYLCDL